MRRSRDIDGHKVVVDARGSSHIDGHKAAVDACGSKNPHNKQKIEF